MKNLIFALLLLNVAGCNKNNSVTNGPEPIDQSETYISYNAGGQNFQFKGGLTSISTSGIGNECHKYNSGGWVYGINGQQGTNNLVLIHVSTDTLKAINYNTFYTLGVMVNGKTYGSYNGSSSTPSNFLLNISRHNQGSIDGTFSGDLINVSGSSGSPVYEHIQITNGVIHNVKVIY